MTFDSDVVALFRMMAEARLPTLDQLSPADARGVYDLQSERLGGPAAAMAEVRDLRAEGGAGAIPLRLYRPPGAPGSGAPLTVFFHGGGWVIGGFASHDKICRAIADAAGCLVVAVDYRLAPEHPAPAAAEDALDAFRWIAAHAAALGADPRRLAVCGDSAGGNLAAVASLAARDEGIALAAQILIYPSVDLRDHASYASRSLNAEVPPLNTALLSYFRSHYLRGDGADRADWRLSPITADKTGVAPALVVVAERDVLRDEGRAYAEALREAGVAVETLEVPGMIHGFIALGGVVGAANRTLAAIGAELRRRFGTA